MKKPVVCVGMSGGVDSSVAAYLLKKQGYDVFGLFMKNWEESEADGSCTAEQDFQDVLKVANTLDIPCYSVNFTKEYQERVFTYFLSELKAGRTPNPDILCNREIKFDLFFKKALSLGADYVATGHYAQTENGTLYQAVDTNKDQTYFLHAVDGKILKQVLFPLGKYTKPQVREIAQKANLSTSQKKDSTGICFIGKRNFKEFVHNYLPYTPGPIHLIDGGEVGQHQGVAFYTIGQRKGLGIGGPGDAYFVVKKNTEKNILYIAQGENHPSLFSSSLEADMPTWVDKEPRFPLHCTAKIRYRQEEQKCTVKKNGDILSAFFESPQRAVTPSQSIVFYQNNICLGGARIQDSALK